jgi:imidazolonepropionase-like amidohydrolase
MLASMRILPLLATLLIIIGCDRPSLAWVSYDPETPPAVLFKEIDVFDGRNVLRNVDVRITSGQIDAVGVDLEAPADAEIIYGGKWMLLPGLIDSHAHLFSAGERGGMPPEPEMIANAFLYSGVTTIFVAAGDPREQAAVRSAATDGRPMPNLRYGGPSLTAPEGHPIPLMKALLPWPIEWLALNSIAIATDAHEAKRATADTIKALNLEYFKIVFDDLPIKSPHLTTASLSAAIETSHELGAKPVVHTTTSGDTLIAAEAGASLLMHAPQKDLLSASDVRRLLKTKIPVVSTVRLIGASHELAAKGPSRLESEVIDGQVLSTWMAAPAWGLPGFSEFVDTNNETIVSNVRKNVQRLIASGVPILAGTDSGVHGVFTGTSLHNELDHLVELGMTPVEALAAATSIPGEFFGGEQSFGRIAPGYQADFMLVRGDPTVDIADLHQICEVWLRGRRLERHAISN